METPAFTQDNLNALNEALSQGASKVKYADKEIEYRSYAEMLQLRNLMLRELGKSNACKGRISTYMDKGL